MPQSAPRTGFTLIELLVVVSIIAVIAALLLPGIALVRETAQKLNCGNNMRQMGVMMLSYASDNDGLLVPVEVGTTFLPADWNWNPASQGPNYGHPRFLGQYDPVMEKYPNFNSYLYAGVLLTRKTTFRCPRDNRLNVNNWAEPTYGLNRRFFPWINGVAENGLTGWNKKLSRTCLSQVKKQAIMVASMEATGGRLEDLGSGNPLSCPPASVTYALSGAWTTRWVPWHRKGCNILYFDGHVNFSSDPSADSAGRRILFDNP